MFQPFNLPLGTMGALCAPQHPSTPLMCYVMSLACYAQNTQLVVPSNPQEITLRLPHLWMMWPSCARRTVPRMPIRQCSCALTAQQ